MKRETQRPLRLVQPIIIGFAADRPQAGKSTAEQFLAERYGFVISETGAIVKEELDRMVRVHGFHYDEAEKAKFRDGLIWWGHFRHTESSPDYWIDRALSRIPAGKPGAISVRYPNEIKKIETRGGIVVKIERSSLPKHTGPTEVQMDRHRFRYTIDNNKNDGGAAMFRQLEDLLLALGVLREA